jgi:hypothetical protein
MLVVKQLETCLTLAGDDIYANLSEVCMANLKSKFLNRCFMSCHIINIKEIIQYGTRIMSQTAEVSASISVKFLVDAIVVDKYEIVLCKIVEREESKQHLIAVSKHAGIRINASMLSQDPYKVGMYVPVIANIVGYSPMKPKFSISAYPFVKIKKPATVWKLTEPVSSDEKEILEVFWSDIKKVERSLSDLKKTAPKSFKFFTDLLGYGGAVAASSKKKEFSFAELVVFPKETLLTMDVISIVRVPKETDIPRAAPALTALSFMLHEILQALTNLETLISGYPTDSKINELKLVWKTYVAFQIST